MIDVSALRMGNIIDFTGVGPVKFMGIIDEIIDYVQLDDFQDQIKLHSDHFEPIILTDEWFKKCGFEKHCGTEVYGRQKGEITLFVYPSGNIEIHVQHSGSVKFDNDTTQLHKLQNMWFAIMQEEINL